MLSRNCADTSTPGALSRSAALSKLWDPVVLQVRTLDQQPGARTCFESLESLFLSYFSTLEIEIPSNCPAAFEVLSTETWYCGEVFLVLPVLNSSVDHVAAKPRAGCTWPLPGFRDAVKINEETVPNAVVYSSHNYIL